MIWDPTSESEMKIPTLGFLVLRCRHQPRVAQGRRQDGITGNQEWDPEWDRIGLQTGGTLGFLGLHYVSYRNTTAVIRFCWPTSLPTNWLPDPQLFTPFLYLETSECYFVIILALLTITEFLWTYRQLPAWFYIHTTKVRFRLALLG